MTKVWKYAGAGLALLATVGLAGCSGGLGEFGIPTGISTTPIGLGTNTVAAKVTLTGVNSATVSLFQDTAVGTEPTLITTAAISNGGTFTVPNLGNGDYTVVISGTGVRPQSDNFSLTGNQTIAANYDVTALSGAPSKQELQGFATLGAHLTRAMYGMRSAVPLANAILQENILHTARVQLLPTFTTTNIAIQNAAGVAVDGAGHVWVPTSAGAGTVLLSNSGTFLGQFFSGVAGAASSSDSVSIDAANDVFILNTGGSVAVFPHGSTTASVTNQTPAGLPLGVAAQNASVTFGAPANVTLSTPHFAVMSLGGLFPATGTGAVFGNVLTNNGTVNTPQSVTVNPSDNTVWVGATNSTNSPNPELIQSPANMSSFQQQINLTTVAGLGANDTINGIAFDANNNLFVATSNSSLPVLKLQNGNTLVASVNGTMATTLFPNGASAIAVDANGNVWATAKGGTTATQFDNNLTSASANTVSVQSNPTQVSIDGNNNAFVAGTNGITRIASGTPVTPPNGNKTFTLPDGSQVTITIANGTTTITQVYPQGPQNVMTFGQNTQSGGNTQVTLQNVSAYGPTTSTTVITQNATTGQLTYTTTTSSAYDGIQTTSTATVNTDGSETVVGSMSNGTAFNCSFKAPDAQGTVTMTGTYTNSVTGITLNVSATFLADGSMSTFTITDVSTGLVATGALSNTGAWNVSITQNGSNTVLTNATDALLQDVLVQFQVQAQANQINNFSAVNISTQGGANVYNTGINGTFSDNTTFNQSGANFNDQTSSGDGNVTAGQGDGNGADSGTGLGTYVAETGGGATLPIRGGVR